MVGTTARKRAATVFQIDGGADTMSGLEYKPDMDEARDRLTAWWQGEDIGRPALLLQAPREQPVEEVPVRPQPEGWVTRYSISDYEYRVYLGRTGCINTHYLAESTPFVSPDLAPNCLALFLGCHGVDMPGTVWCEPFITEPGDEVVRFDPENIYWRFSWKLGQELKRLGEGKFLLQFPDFIEGLDTLAAMRGSEELLIDLVERPEWVSQMMNRITEVYFEYYDRFYELIKDERGGSVFWAWAPGRMCKLQCDFSAMISPTMFAEFMMPVLRSMTPRFDHCMYHWDGPGAIPHQDLILSLPELDVVQWTPGAGVEHASDPRWFPLHHKTIAAGKKVFIACDSIDSLKRLKAEFGRDLNNFLIRFGAENLDEAERFLLEAER
jgi:5-methyltetrahydrofolate--homocysteine methyltransferase